jgi:hypothetical protein
VFNRKESFSKDIQQKLQRVEALINHLV